MSTQFHSTSYSLANLGTSIREVAEFVDDTGWDQRPEMFALVPTSLLAETDPSLIHDLDSAGLTPIEQAALHEDIDQHPDALGEIVSGITWPDSVVGAILVRQIVVLPPGADADVDADPTRARRNPASQDARLYSGVLRDGRGLSLLQLRTPDGAVAPSPVQGRVELLQYEGLGAEMLDALRATFEADPED
ncbi:PPA1309 family protein [Tomitella biformata]|uniref:PPA1309 family protein n=1 Tax=Tomitella biformata TaxID=630403 RepID=UPI000462F204|nr:PPA1309 family protein [Tomitella biformata]